MQIQITGVTSGNSPYDIYVCNWDLTACFYVSGVTTIPPNITINTNNYLPSTNIIKVKIVDADGCVEIIEFPCGPTPTPTPTPVPTPTPTPCVKPSGLLEVTLCSGYYNTLESKWYYFSSGSTTYVGEQWNKRVEDNMSGEVHYTAQTQTIEVGQTIYRKDLSSCDCNIVNGSYWMYINSLDYFGPVYPNVYIMRVSNCKIASITLWEYS